AAALLRPAAAEAYAVPSVQPAMAG
ncbi:MAG: hypothetical protein QOI78_1217, partial [Actinomycetota bacterium]|nr:hypothetical protein [Actinomycetota bacterium]